MIVYLDVCCLNRPFDDQSQMKIRLETEAILSVLRYCSMKTWQKRAEDLQKYGIKLFDALHIASAEAGNADVFLSTDIKLLKAAKRANLYIHVDKS